MFFVFEQHDHALVSGAMARRWTPPPTPFESTVFAVENHDVAWRELDREVLWDDERTRPVSFIEYPSAPKVRAYAGGIDVVEARDPYAAYLCSMHYATVVAGSKHPDEQDFARHERERQERLRLGFSREESENLERNLRLLKVCDGLSLFLCLNEPGRTGRLFPPYEGGFHLDGAVYRPGWEGRNALVLDPSPFGGDFEVAIPYRVIAGDGNEAGGGEMRMWIRGRKPKARG
jgi:Protein of unknown function (DUF3891)